MLVPEDLRYSTDHEWARPDGSRVRVGLTDYAQDALGEIGFVDLPQVGRSVSPGDVLGEVESAKSVSEIYAPVGGTVVAVNDALAGKPERLNDDPYGDGWLCEIEISDPDVPDGSPDDVPDGSPDDVPDGALDDLLDAAGYRRLTEG